MTFAEVKDKYNELLKRNSKSKSHSVEQDIVDLLESFLQLNNITNDQKLWAYWNISDNYALQRKHTSTYHNLLRFEEFVRSIQNSYPNYMLMLICDTTQRLSLIEGGKSDYWSNLYREIINKLDINDSNYCIYFEVLRTALYPTTLSSDFKLADDAIERMKYLVQKYINDSQHLRFELLYYTSLLTYNYINVISNVEILSKSFQIFSKLKLHLKDNKIKDNELFGTYESWNNKRSLWYQARCINDYIITLIDTENYELANKCYIEIGKDEFTNVYFKKKINILKENIKRK